jgi:hypothetical protein
MKSHTAEDELRTMKRFEHVLMSQFIVNFFALNFSLFV